MKRICCIVLLLLILTGCGDTQRELNAVLKLRSDMMHTGCSFNTQITADYGNKIYTFAMGCKTDAHGNLYFEVIEPETLAGIKGEINNDGGKLIFESTALSFEMLADGQITPVSAPWILTKTLLGGYLSTTVSEGTLLHITAMDSYRDDALQLEVWLDGEHLPVQAEILYKDRRILSMLIENFRIL